MQTHTTQTLLNKLAAAGSIAEIATHILNRHIQPSEDNLNSQHKSKPLSPKKRSRDSQQQHEEQQSYAENALNSIAIDITSSSIQNESDSDNVSICSDKALSIQPQPLILTNNDIWAWQYAKECESMTGKSDSELETAIALMWEPNREWYGIHAWWTWDQYTNPGAVFTINDSSFDRPTKFVKVNDCSNQLGMKNDEFEFEAAVSESIINDDSNKLDIAAPFEHIELLAGKEFTITELFEPEEPKSSNLNKNRRRNKSKTDSDILIGMEVERDVIYDESELTQEEIEIQRWSIAWKAKRVAEIAEEQAQEKSAVESSRKLVREQLAKAHHEQSYAYKTVVYPSLYGEEKTELIITLEAEMQKKFEECGGAGNVQHLVPIGEEHEYYHQKPKFLAISSTSMVAPQHSMNSASFKNKVADEFEEEGEMKEGEEDGEIEELEMFENENSTRILWPVLPIRP
ncbi:hypothetical protein HK100_005939 [Physocladia obscura]|uniref:Uncharacterized protein n=1 Tax=Physocladia obscura TaxID=109957 RepID=A0AAD5XGA8_9FUNG|nr:hypothetical protein HK100_005939 [Physocladia obscura]